MKEFNHVFKVYGNADNFRKLDKKLTALLSLAEVLQVADYSQLSDTALNGAMLAFCDLLGEINEIYSDFVIINDNKEMTQ